MPVAIGEGHAFQADRVAEREPLDRYRLAVAVVSVPLERRDQGLDPLQRGLRPAQDRAPRSG